MTSTRLSTTTAHPTNHPTNHPNTILGRLHDEWHHITIRSTELRAVRTWGLPGMPVASLDELLARCGYRPAPGSAPTAYRPAEHDDEACLLRLVEVARTDALAARIVLQRILPALCAVAGRHSSNRAQRNAVLDDLVANAWPIIRNYPCERRPRFIVANLVRDTSFETFVRPVRRRSSGEIPTMHEHLDHSTAEPALDPLHELVAVLNEALAQGIDQADIDLLAQIVTLGRPEEVAVVLNVTARTVRNHRNAIVHRLRNIVLEAA